MSQFDFVSVATIPNVLHGVLLDPPSWTRLEPISITGDPAPGLEARVHDPLWMLARQWQLGEFEGEDAGTPITVSVTHRTRPVTAWKPGALLGPEPPRPLARGEALDPQVEREPGPVALGWRARADAGAHLLEMLAEAGVDRRAALVGACPLPDADAIAAAHDPARTPDAHLALPPEHDLIAATTPDGLQAAEQLEDDGQPAWLAGAGPDAEAAAADWHRWFRTNVAPATDNPSWVDDRFEYRFCVRAGEDADQIVFVAPAHEGGMISWFSFDAASRASMTIEGEGGADRTESTTRTMLASPLRFAGMPADRYWQFEDGQVNLARLDAQPQDLARLCVAEFAMVYGNDWIVVPLTLDAGSFTQITRVTYTTTFNETFEVERADDGVRTGRFRLFETSLSGRPDQSVPGLLVPPVAPDVIEGPALEEVVFLRDEMANMAWGIERTVEAASGDPRSRTDEGRPINRIEGLEPGTDTQYLLETEVPTYWIPFVPVATGIGAIELRKGTMADHDLSLGTVLEPTPMNVQDEEIPREGLRVRRLPALARAADGRYVRWITRRASVGKGEGSSGLAFDGAYVESVAERVTRGG